MDNMERPAIIAGGIDDTLDRIEAEDLPAPVDKADPVKPVRRPFITWAVKGRDYQLKLTSATIMQLEQKFKCSLLDAVMEQGLPPINTVLTVLQAGMQKFQHGITSYKVGDLLDTYFDEGHSQIELLRDVIYPLMGDAGFFTEAQLKALTTEMQDVDSAI